MTRNINLKREDGNDGQTSLTRSKLRTKMIMRWFLSRFFFLSAWNLDKVSSEYFIFRFYIVIFFTQTCSGVSTGGACLVCTSIGKCFLWQLYQQAVGTEIQLNCSEKKKKKLCYIFAVNFLDTLAKKYFFVFAIFWKLIYCLGFKYNLSRISIYTHTWILI